MSLLQTFTNSGSSLHQTSDYSEIAAALSAVGVRFERWDTEAPLQAEASQDDILDAYRTSVDRILNESGFQSVDVISMSPDHPQKTAFREKFLNEHTHSEFEIRFFVEGSGQFYLHIGDKVFMVRCDAGDLISVPANTTHWFDMGPNPAFRAIRFFTNPEGWVANFTGSDIASRFPLFE